MKLALVSIVLCAAIYAATATKLLASSSRQLNRRETNYFKRLFKRQAYNGECFERIFDLAMFSMEIQIKIVILVLVLYPIVAKIS
jgi:hypothetical protein